MQVTNGPIFDNLVEDIYSVLGGTLAPAKYGHQPALIEVESIANLYEKPAKVTGTLRGSNIGKPCMRALWYEEREFPREGIAPYVQLKFMFGHALESLILRLAELAGHQVTLSQAPVELEGIKGHIDSVIDGVLVDVKTASPYAFERFAKGELTLENDHFGYLWQLAFYRQALLSDPAMAKIYTGRAGFLVIHKVTGQLCWFEPPNLDKLNVRQRIHHVRETVSTDKLPDRPYKDKDYGKSGNKCLDVSCSYCPYKFECWNDANGGDGLRVFVYNHGPVFLTDVQREPKVPEVMAPGDDE